ncbi:hypothetical protein KL912_002699 [Ogataea haglerorum]|nr:hypothetical protein KL912_002699 [Ogataea haglerorum]KAG7802182.1 hypothetical protein KL944_002559 [Ogataea haglerorum]
MEEYKDARSVDELSNIDKLDTLGPQGQDLEARFEQYEILAEEAKSHNTLWDRMVLKSGYTFQFKEKKYMVRMLAFFASLGGMLSGVDQSLISGAKVSLVPSLSLTSHEQSLVSALMPVGAMGGCIFLSPLNEFLGRRLSIMVACISYTRQPGVAVPVQHRARRGVWLRHRCHVLFARRRVEIHPGLVAVFFDAALRRHVFPAGVA